MREKHGLRGDLAVDEPIDSIERDVGVFVFEAVRELLFNVVKHARTGSARVSVTRKQGYLHVAVADQGPGFDPRLVEQRPDLDGGFGLLSIRERLDNMGGRMEIHSIPGKGTTVTLTAPLSLQ